MNNQKELLEKRRERLTELLKGWQIDEVSDVRIDEPSLLLELIMQK